MTCVGLRSIGLNRLSPLAKSVSGIKIRAPHDGHLDALELIA